MHRDLKPQNILLTSKDYSAALKLVDFGLSKKTPIISVAPGVQNSLNFFTPVYSAPEVLNGISEYTYKIDMWALGAILYEMIFGKTLFEGANNVLELQKMQ